MILCTLFLLAGQPVPEDGGITRILLVGDSWADYMWQDQVLRSVFLDEGHAILEKGDVTAISGSTAAEWASPAFLQSIEGELSANPSIDLVQLTMGGNDFLAGMSGGGWYAGMPPAEEEALYQQVQQDLETVIDHLLGYDPELEIVLSFYDYPNFVETLVFINFVCNNLWDDLNQPTPTEMNQLLVELMVRVRTTAAIRPRVSLVEHLGLMQFHFGYPSMGILGGELLPPGDLTLPSPPEAMRLGGLDCFHLNAEGYRVLAQNLYDTFYSHHFCVQPIQLQQAEVLWPAQDVLVLSDLINRLCE